MYSKAPHQRQILSVAAMIASTVVATCAGPYEGRDGVECGVQSVGPVATSIGSESGVDLDYVGHVAEAASGLLAVSQPRLREVFIFSAKGILVRRLGSQGQGPGEFERISAVGWIGDTVWIYDSGRRRFTTYEPNGDVRVIPFITHDGRVFEPILLTRTGEVVGLWKRPYESPDSVVAIVAVDRHLRTIAVFDSVTQRHEYTFLEQDGFVFQMPQPYSDDTLWDGAGSGEYFVTVQQDAASTDTETVVEVTVFDPTRGASHSFELPYNPIRLPGDEADSVVRVLQGRSRAGLEETAVRNVLFLPDFLPPVSAVHQSSGGFVWVRWTGPEEATECWEIYDRLGERQARFGLDGDWHVLEVVEDKFWYMELDSLDVPSVRARRIQLRPPP